LIRRKSALESEDMQRGALLASAVRRRERMQLQQLLARGVDRHSLDDALSVAAEVAPPAMVRDLLTAGADPEVRDHFGFTTLMRAAGRGQARVVRVLLEHGAEVNAKSDPGPDGAPALLRTPLMLAAMSGDLRTLFLLLRAGADPLAIDRHGYTALHWAAYRAAPSAVIQTLLAQKVPVDARDASERTPLMLAAWQNALPAAEVLVVHRAQVNARDQEGASAWMWAVKWSNTEIARLLVENGAQVEAEPNWVVPADIRRQLPPPQGAGRV
jgi:ankyrin repeat protein